MLDAHLAGMKAALKLTPDQEKNWAPFEAAVRDAAKARVDAMHAMREAMRDGERPSPIDHMNTIADRPRQGFDRNQGDRRRGQAALRQPRRNAEAVISARC